MTEPAPDCSFCARLVGFRAANQGGFPDYRNAPVPAFGAAGARLLVVGLAPGLHGANRTGRPFTGDYAGDLLYATLLANGLASGVYARAPDDGLALCDTRVTNAVRCVPPENKPTGVEIRTCNAFLATEIAGMPHLKCILALGRIAHDAAITALGRRASAYKFAHGARHALPDGRVLFDSYHCSRYNTNTGRLTPAMFQDVIGAVARELALSR